MNVKQYISTLDLVEGRSTRCNCPVCGGRNTFTVSREDGKVLYNCYKASCRIAGAYQKDRSLKELNYILSRVSKPEEPTFTLPPHLVSGAFNTFVQEYASSVHAENAELMYDPEEHRAVFVIRDRDSKEPLGAVGRALNKNMIPKWKRYDKRNDLLYITGDGDTAVVVEDCASAAAVASAGFIGIAVLGTNLSAGVIPKFKPYKKVIIALDKDASKKALKLKKMLDPYTNSAVRFLPDDLKYFPPTKIQAILHLSR